jgi:hypothetical protein
MGMKPMFLPISESASGGVFLPGLAPEPASTAMMFPPGTYPIMASGEYVGTLFPLADPLPPPQMPYMPDSAQVAHALGINPDSLAPLAEPLPTAVDPDQRALPPMSVPFPEMPYLAQPEVAPISTEANPLPSLDMASLAPPLPTSTAPGREPMPPASEPFPDVPFLPPPDPQPITSVPQVASGTLDTAPLSRPLPTTRDMVREPLAPDVTPLPDVRLPAPESVRDIPIPEGALSTSAPSLPAPSGELAAMQGRPVLADMAEVLKQLADRQGALAAQTEGRSRLRAGEPSPNLGNVVWQRQWGQS